MSSPSYLLAIDQGTTNSRAHVFSFSGKLISTQQIALTQHYPQAGWLEQSPEEMWLNTLECCRQALNKNKLAATDIAAMGITNQRETTIIWDKKTGETIYPAINWQDRRTAELCSQLTQHSLSKQLQEKTGLLLDPYFSASKIAWVLEQVEGARQRAEKGELLFGTIDTFLLWRLTKGKMHATDATNASRTLLFNIRTQQWDHDILNMFNIPICLLPQVLDSSADFGKVDAAFFGHEIPIASMVGDQQAALIGQTCFQPGMIKSTYGTGCFIVLNTGNKLVISSQHLLSTIAYRIKGNVTYALEGSIFSAGTTIKWLRDKLKLIQSSEETEILAQKIEDTGGVYLIPAFTGLGAPYWDPYARAALVGLNFNSGVAQIARAALEAVVYQTRDLIDAMIKDSPQLQLSFIKVDGGMAANNWLLQFLADILNLKVERPVCTETTALGAAFLAGLQIGIYQSLDEIAALWQLNKEFLPTMSAEKCANLYAGWQCALLTIKKRKY